MFTHAERRVLGMVTHRNLFDQGKVKGYQDQMLELAVSGLDQQLEWMTLERIASTRDAMVYAYTTASSRRVQKMVADVVEMLEERLEGRLKHAE